MQTELKLAKCQIDEGEIFLSPFSLDLEVDVRKYATFLLDTNPQKT
jgi:hypothetical protein